MSPSVMHERAVGAQVEDRRHRAADFDVARQHRRPDRRLDGRVGELLLARSRARARACATLAIASVTFARLITSWPCAAACRFIAWSSALLRVVER